MPLILLLGILGAGAYYLSTMVGGGLSMLGNSDPSNRLFGLKDVDPSEQGGSYKTDYDVHFESVAADTGVPFALLKAHAIMESSLNPQAFTDENPKNLDSRQGWASRGLMQVLWWPGSNRFDKYGVSDDDIGQGDGLFDPHTNIKIGAAIIKENLNSVSGNLRDAVNMYNTGKKESVYEAPGNYVDKVVGYYNKLIGG